MLAFSRSADSRSTLPEALAAMAGEAAALMGATRASIWLHDRRTRELWLVASSEAGVADGTRVAADAPETPAALALTLESPVRLGSSIIAPLRGWRRALGALILEGETSPELTGNRASNWPTTSLTSCPRSSRTCSWSRKWFASIAC